MGCLEIHFVPDTGRFIVVNSFTGLWLRNKRGTKVKTFRTVKGAQRFIIKREDALINVIASIKKMG